MPFEEGPADPPGVGAILTSGGSEGTFRFIPTASSGSTHYKQTTTLGGRRFLLSFSWNQRRSVWALDISNTAGDLLLAGASLVPGASVLAGHLHDDRLPQGVLTVLDSQGRGSAPGVQDMGRNRPFQLLWIPGVV